VCFFLLMIDCLIYLSLVTSLRHWFLVMHSSFSLALPYYVLLMFFGTSLLCIPNVIHCFLCHVFLCLLAPLCYVVILFFDVPLMCVLDVFLALPCYVFLDILLCTLNVHQHLFVVCFLCFLAPPCYALPMFFSTSLLCALNFVDQVPFWSLSDFCNLLIVFLMLFGSFLNWYSTLFFMQLLKNNFLHLLFQL
jgi:hypothetical protein